MNVLILALEFVVIFVTLIMFIGEKEDNNEHFWAWNGALVGAILIMFALNFATICRGLEMCFSCGASEVKDASSTRIEQDAKKAIAKLRWVQAGNTGEPPKTGGFFSFGDDTPEIDLKHFSDPDEAALFFDLTPGEITKVANDEARKIVKQRRTEEQEERRQQVAKNLQAIKEQKEVFRKPAPVATDDAEYRGRKANEDLRERAGVPINTNRGAAEATKN